MKPEHARALVLNADYLPMGIISWRRALTLSLENQQDFWTGLEAIDFFDSKVTTAGGRKFPIPAVVRVPIYVKKTRKQIPFSRKNVFLRDHLTCQYCGLYTGSSKGMTYDHVIPRATWKKQQYVGTPTKWTNIVTCCEPCNKSKADRSLRDCEMKLLREPKEPNPHQYILGLSPWCKIPEQWEPYLTPLYKHLKRK